MANIFKLGNQIRLGRFAADPSSPENGVMIYRTDTNEFRVYKNGAWANLTTGSVSLTGQTLNEFNLLVGNGSNQSAAVNTNSVGDILASSSGGLEIKAGVIVNADINASAAIAYSKLNLSASIVNADVAAAAAIARSKLASGTAHRLVQNDASGVMSDAAAITAARALISDANGIPTHSSVTSTELDYVSGVTSAIQTQLNAKLALAGGTMSGNIAMGGNKVTGLGAPTTSTDAATKGYVDSVAEGLKPKAAARVATTAAGTLATSFENGDTIDGVVLATGNRILIKDQAAPAENGIYTVNASGAPTRATDFDSLSPIDEINGAMVGVQEGTANAGKIFVQYGTVATLGTDPINFVYFNSSAALVGGDGITVSGSNISVDHDGEGLTFSATQLALELDGSTLSKSASGLKVADGGITNTQVNASAGIVYSKLSLTGSIVNADINASAAIAYSKLAALTASRALVSDGSGFVSASAVTSTELGYVSGVTSAIQTQLDGKANQALSNLASVAINVSLISDTNNTDDLGSNSIEWKDLWIHNIKHDDATNPDLVISSTQGDVRISGNQQIELQSNMLKLSDSPSSTDFMEIEYEHAKTLTASTSNEVQFSFAKATYVSFVLEYQIKEATSNAVRVGQLSIVTNGTDISQSDSFNETADVGVTWDAVVNGANIDIRSTTTANNKTLRGMIKRMLA